MRILHLLTAFIVIVLVFNACSSTQPVATKETPVLPHWYLNPPGNSEAYLYGVGEGNDMDEARKKALETMVSQLGVSISSKYESSLKVHKKYTEYFTKETSFELTSEVAKIRISNHEVVESKKLSYKRFIVLVRSNRLQFFQPLQKEVQHKLKIIQTESETIRHSDVLSRYAFYDKSLQGLNGMFSTVLVISAIEDNYDDRAYFDTVDKLKTQYQSLKEKITFSLQCDGNSQAFKEEISVALKNRHYRITAGRSDVGNITIVLHSTTNYVRAHGFDIARTVLAIEVKDNKGKAIGGNRINLIAQATQGKNVALDNTAKKLKKLIQNQGIGKIIGLGVELSPK
jgi:PIN domain nuclease of toxin-antitoxin system